MAKKTYTAKQIKEAINHWQKKLDKMNEASYGGQHGYSDPSMEPPNQKAFIKMVQTQQDDDNAELLISILNEVGKNSAALRRMFAEAGESVVSEFLENLVANMSAADYSKYVQVLF